MDRRYRHVLTVIEAKRGMSESRRIFADALSTSIHSRGKRGQQKNKALSLWEKRLGEGYSPVVPSGECSGAGHAGAHVSVLPDE